MSMKVVTAGDVAEGLRRVGAAGRPVCLHVSLRSFGGIEDGPEALVQGCRLVGSTALSPSFAGTVFGLPAPPWDHPRQNGQGYDEPAVLGFEEAAKGPIYTPASTRVDSWLGATAAFVAAHPERRRGASPGCSWSAIGPLAAELVGDSIESDDFGPLRRLVDRDGIVLLMGVSLTSLTLIHLAEVKAGRRPFIFWARGPGGDVIRVRGGRCSKGFDRFEGVLSDVERRTSVGASLWHAYPAEAALTLATAAIRSTPEITRCSTTSCVECRDAIAGGPFWDRQ